MKTSMQYKQEAHDLKGVILRGATHADRSLDELNGLLNRLSELSRLAGMAEVCERANALFVFESKGV